MKTEVNPFFCPMDKKMFPLILNDAGLTTIFFKTNSWYLKFMLYHAVIYIFWDTLKKIPF